MLINLLFNIPPTYLSRYKWSVFNPDWTSKLWGNKKQWQASLVKSCHWFLLSIIVRSIWVKSGHSWTKLAEILRGNNGHSIFDEILLAKFYRVNTRLTQLLKLKILWGKKCFFFYLFGVLKKPYQTQSNFFEFFIIEWDFYMASLYSVFFNSRLLPRLNIRKLLEF